MRPRLLHNRIGRHKDDSVSLQRCSRIPMMSRSVDEYSTVPPTKALKLITYRIGTVLCYAAKEIFCTAQSLTSALSLSIPPDSRRDSDTKAVQYRQMLRVPTVVG